MKTNIEISLRRHITAAKIASISLAAAALFIASSPAAQAASATWAPTAAGTFSWTNSTDWSPGIPGATGNPNSTTCTDTASFGALTGAETVTVDSGRNVENIIIDNTSANAYTFAGGPLILTAGGSIVSNGTTGNATFSANISLEGNYLVSNTSTGLMTFSGNITQQLAGTLTLFASNGVDHIPSTTNPTPGSYYGNFNVVSGVLGQASGQPLSVTVGGNGATTTGWAFDGGSSTYTGTTTIDGALLNANTLANEGVASSIGEGNSSLNGSDLVINGGELQYSDYAGSTTLTTKNVSGISTNRDFTIGDSSGTLNTADIDSSAFMLTNYNSAVGTLSFLGTAPIAFGDTGNHTLTLSGYNIGNNNFDLQITDQNTSSGDITSLTKTGSGTWILDNPAGNTYTGTTTIQGGILGDLTGTGVSSLSNLVINDGVYQTSANINRALGAAAGNVEIVGSTSIYLAGNIQGANGGVAGPSGFSAYSTTPNSTITLTLGSAGSTVQFGSTFFNPQEYILNAPTANSTLNATNNYDLNGATRTIETDANTAIISGAISNSSPSVFAGLDKAGSGTLELTAVNSYNGLTGVSGGVLWAEGSGTLGANTGVINVGGGGELRVDSLSDIPGTVLLNHGALGVTFNATQAGLAAVLNSNSTGILAIDAAQSNALNMAALGNGAMYLGSSTSGTYSASTLGINSGGTELDSGGAPNQIATFGGSYLLGGGGGTLTLTGQNVLTNQPASLLLNNYTGTAPGQSLLTSNNYNSLIVGDGSTAGQPNGGGTVDLQNSQNYLGTTTINAGATLNLDYSGGLASISTAGNVNIISQYTPVILNGGTLEVTGGAGSADTQSLASVTSNLGANTINVASNGATSVTLNLGALSANNGAMTVFSETGTTAAITTTTGPITANSGTGTYGTALGAAYLYNNNGTYSFAGESAPSSGIYTLGALTGETILPASGASSTTDYLQTAAGTLTASESLNLLRISSASNVNETLTGAFKLTTNGILYDGSGTGYAAIAATSGITSSSGNLYIYNYAPNSTVANTMSISQLGGSFNGDFIGPGTLVINSPITGNTNATFGGPGVILLSATPTNTGNLYLDGAQLVVLGGNLNTGASVKALVINSGGLYDYGAGSGTQTFSAPEVWNGNFTLGFGTNVYSGDATATVSNTVTLTNNITITFNAYNIGGGNGEGSNNGQIWNYSGTLTDGGFGYGLTLGANTLNPTNPNIPGFSAALNSALAISGTTSFTGPITLLGGAIHLGSLTATNRFNVLTMAADTTVDFSGGGLASSYSLAGLQDVGAPSPTEIIANDNSGSGSGTPLNITLYGNGNYSFGGVIANEGGNTLSGVPGVNVTALTMDGAGGTQTLTGANTFTDGLTVNAGTLIVDASKGGSIASQALALGGGTFELTGASGGTTQSFTSTGVSTSSTSVGLSKIEPNSTIGTTTINLAGIAVANGGVLDIAPIGSNGTVTTTTTTTNGVLGLGNIVYTNPTTGVTTWATTSGGTPSPITAYTGDTTALLTTGNSASTNYMITGSQTQGAATGVYNLRISNTSTNTLNLSTFNLALSGDGVLYNGSAAYTITGGSLNGNNGANQLVIDNFGTGGLTIASTIGNRVAGTATALTLAGTGTTYLTGTNTYTGTTYFDGGTVNFNSSNNFSGSTAFVFGGGTLQYATGNTYDLSNKTLTPNASGATFDTNGNAVTWNHNFGSSGVGGITFVDSANAANPGSAAGSITIFGDAQNTGAVTVDNGGVVNLNGALNTAGYTYVGPIGTLEGGTTQATSGTQSTSSAYAGKLVLQSGGVVSPGSPGVGASPNSGGAGTGIQGGGVGSGGNLNANVSGIVNNVLSATQLQWYAGGTLSFYLDDTGYAGASAGAPVASTQLNLALGSLAKMGGTGQYILNFNNTGGYYVNGGTVHSNVYDLINFGGPTVANNENPNGNTDFNVDDFTIENLDGIGVLSFYYNPLANGGNGTTIPGQEELLLTVIPEPSTWAMLIGGLATLIFWTRRKRAAANRSLARK